jgi:hypothetical protein
VAGLGINLKHHGEVGDGGVLLAHLVVADAAIVEGVAV